MSRYLRGLIGLIIVAAVVAGVVWLGKDPALRWLGEREAERVLAQDPTPAVAAPDRLDGERMFADLEWLAAPEREGRFPGQPGGLAARAWLVERMQEIGLEPAGSDGYLQPFTLTARDGRYVEDAANVIGRIPGRESGLPSIVITAHYDHLGVRDGDIYHGADDNASGTAALLEIARFLAPRPTRHPLLFAAVDAEEQGKVGAEMLFELGLLDPGGVAFNVNLDMISRDLDNVLFAVGTWHHPWLHPVLDRVQHSSAVRILRGHDRPWWRAGTYADWTDSSDHLAFHLRGIPFIYFGVDDHPDYHRPTDTAERVDRDFYRRAAETVLSFILEIDEALR
jgi:hypothetical protein